MQKNAKKMNIKLNKIAKLILLFFVTILSSCEKEGISSAKETEVKNNDISIKYVSGKNIPNIISKINPNYGSAFKSSNSKSSLITDSFGSISVENILEVIDSLGNKNYSFTLTPKKPKPNSIFNLVVSTSNGNMNMAIVEYRMAPHFAQEYYNGTKSMSEFTGNILRFPFKAASSLFSKTSYTCVQNIDEIVNCDEVIVDEGTIIVTEGGGGSTTISDTNTYTGGDGGTVINNYGSGGGGSVAWICNAYGVTHSGPTNCGDGSGTWVITLFPDSHTSKLSNPKGKTSSTSCCDETNLVGTIGINLFNLAVSVRDTIGISPKSQESLWLTGSATIEQVASLSNFLEINNNSSESINFTKEIITQMRLNPGLAIDVSASFKSPTNIDRSSITNATPEGQKFNLVYDALTKSPEFKKLFLDLFQDNSRFNVKFEIGNVSNGANGNTNTDLNNPTLNTIIISPTFLNNSNKMEIAKTIIHECIHAYLNIKMVDPNVGMSILNLNNMEFCDVVNQQYNNFSSGQNQHNFIYNFMLPTMQTILAEVKDTLVTPADNINMLALNFHPTSPTINVAFNWNDFYLNLSLAGLQNCSSFQNEIGILTINTNGQINILSTIDQIKMYNFNQYNYYGHLYLPH